MAKLLPWAEVETPHHRASHTYYNRTSIPVGLEILTPPAPWFGTETPIVLVGVVRGIKAGAYSKRQERVDYRHGVRAQF